MPRRTSNSRWAARLKLQGLEERRVPATLLVTNNTDSGPGSFRQAILDANAAIDADTIQFTSNFFSTPQIIALKSQLPTITRPVTVVGTGRDNCIIDGGASFSILSVAHNAAEAPMAVSLQNLTFRNGAGNSGTAGLSLGADSITIQSCNVMNNTGLAGGISANGSTLTITNSTISGNSSKSSGAGLQTAGNTIVTVNGSTFSGNVALGSSSAGGLQISSGQFTMSNSTVSGNSCGQVGGGIKVALGVTLATFTHCTITNNTAESGGGMRLDSPATLTATIISGNIATDKLPDIESPASLTLNHCALGDSTEVTFTDAGGNVLGGDLKLQPLADYGSGNKTHSLKAGSAAINTGVAISGFSKDQRGITYDATPDIGAFESVGPKATIATIVGIDSTNATSPVNLFITYTDDLAVDASTISVGDILVLSPSAIYNDVSLISTTTSADGLSVTAQFQVNPPAGGWTGFDSGGYIVGALSNNVSDFDGLKNRLSVFSQFYVAVHSFTVNSLADSGGRSLRAATGIANGLVGADTISFASGLTGTITLTSGEIGITDSLVINGPGAGLLTISGNKASRIFNSKSSLATATFAVDGITMTAGSSIDDGGAILAGDEQWTLTNCAITSSTATTSGGAISFIETGAGSLTIQNCTLMGNSAGSGGAINIGTTSIKVTITSSTIANNLAGIGGGIYFTAGHGLTIDDSTLSGNSSGSSGGAIYSTGMQSSGEFTIRNSTLSSNSTGGRGGAVAFANYSQRARIYNSTITANTANSASGGGGFSLLSGTGTISFDSSIISGNIDQFSPNKDIETNGRVDLVRSAVGSKSGIADLSYTNDSLFGVDLKLGTLANNGGSTQTHALLIGSPAIDAGGNGANSKYDQRGTGFNRETNGKPDIGAYEWAPPAPRVTSVVIGDGSAQRSRINSVVINFDSIVTIANNSAFQLTRISDNATISSSSKFSNNTATSVTVTFTGATLENGSLADGRYRLTVNAAKIDNLGVFLDGNNDGTGGDNYVLNSTGTTGIFRLFGDVNGDAKVDSIDFGQFRAAFNSASPNAAYTNAFDFNNDGKIDSVDFGAFRARFNTVI